MPVLKVSSSDYTSVPVGTYRARLLGYKEMPASSKFPDSGPSFVWEFEVLEGEFSGKTVSRWTPTNLTMGNGFGKLVRELRGGPIKANEEIDPDHFINKQYQITVGPNADGQKTKVIMVSPISNLAPPAAPTAAPPGAPPATKKQNQPAPPPPPASQEKVFFSRDGVEKAEFMPFDEAYKLVDKPGYDKAMVWDPKKSMYVPARDYLLPF